MYTYISFYIILDITDFLNQQLTLHLLCKGLVYNRTLSHGHPAANSRYSPSFLQAVQHCIIYACQLMRLHNCTIAPHDAPSAIIWNSPFWLPRKPRTRACQLLILICPVRR